LASRSGIGKTACAVWEADPEHFVSGSERHETHAGAQKASTRKTGGEERRQEHSATNRDTHLGAADSLHLKKVLRKGKKLQRQLVMLSDSRQG
jgi:hypothetical protein